MRAVRTMQIAPENRPFCHYKGNSSSNKNRCSGGFADSFWGTKSDVQLHNCDSRISRNWIHKKTTSRSSGDSSQSIESVFVGFQGLNFEKRYQYTKHHFSEVLHHENHENFGLYYPRYPSYTTIH